MESRRSQISMDSFLDAETEQMSKMMKNAELTIDMFLIAHNLPFLLMDVFPDLLTECCPDSEVAKRLKCARTKATKITDDISNATTKDLISKLKSCKFSITIDETTDVSTKKCLVLVVRYVASFIVRDRFLALIELPKCDASSVFEVLKNFFHNNNIPLKNIIGLATDGANVMAGHLSGVKALLEAETNIFYLKCTCHSLHLCVSYACKKLPGDVVWLCRNIYSFFSHSPKRVHDFAEFQDNCSVKPHKILGISYTRWLSLEGVVSRLIEQWDALKLFFINCKLEVNAVRSVQLAEKMNNEIKVYFLFLSYVLPLINNLNKEFQLEQSRLPYLYSNIKSHYLLILSNFIKKDIQLHVDIDYKNIHNYNQTSKIFIGTKAEFFLLKTKATLEEVSDIKGEILKFYIALLDQIKLRFDFMRKDLEILKIITPIEFLSNNDNSILDLILQFEYLCNTDCDKIVWTDYKYNAKRKLTQRMKSMTKTGGGPYDAVSLNHMEERIVAAAKIGEHISGVPGATSYGCHTDGPSCSTAAPQADDNFVCEYLAQISSADNSSSDDEGKTSRKSEPPKINIREEGQIDEVQPAKTKRCSDPKIKLIEKEIEKQEKFQSEVLRLSSLIIDCLCPMVYILTVFLVFELDFRC
ncbi:uncharacterized protein LOC128870314 [Anastrepha ludens]|uniref:uncharacterized protein LOC128870314 n=1 Tax=Anastrepha ludens TaxID=28586 RepID=UPI0023AF4A67|nr:uncharacterized protein LOC128870314 [Anastrepha ludens]